MSPEVDRAAGARGDLDGQVGAVREGAEAVAVAPGEAHLVEQAGGLLRIVLGPQPLPTLRLVEAGGGVDGGGGGPAQPQEVHLVQLVAVQGQRHGAAEAHFVEQRAVVVILVGGVESVRAAHVDAGNQRDGVVAALLILLVVGQGGEVGHGDGPVDLAGDRLQVASRRVLGINPSSCMTIASSACSTACSTPAACSVTGPPASCMSVSWAPSPQRTRLYPRRVTL